ncbi:unnamed protein product [Chilo suppressalis]|uniref:NF-kappa-B essential modulator NEMO CC2-LZ domain-containing protein n=1 Tax=Chilo suppressalis TaxID=168631 RepID=A0ABN8B5B6_CHISP|nr:unnamed protein product [Chilo suppressalis]
MAYKAHFELGDCPSPASMMVASTIVTDDSSTEDLQKRFGELLDENVILKETLKRNNDSMKEQFLLIASCQDDMMKTQILHKEKFEETKVLVDKLRNENRKLKQDLLRSSETETQTPDSLANRSDPSLGARSGPSSGARSGPSSGVEFVTSPDDDTINKLTAQLELIEKQRRQVLIENEKLTWQKESLEHIVDATSKERDELKEKFHNLEYQMSCKENESLAQVGLLKATIQDLQTKLTASGASSIPSEELLKRDSIIQQLDGKMSTLQTELKNAQLRILELENVKLEYTKHKSGVSETVRIYKEQLQELNDRLREAQTTVFQPVRVSLGVDTETPSTASECASLMTNVKLYDRSLKHLADLLNALTLGLTDSLVEAMGVASSLLEVKLDKSSVEEFKACLGDLRHHLEKQHSASLNHIAQVKSTLSIFEGIFKDYNELLKKNLTKQEIKPPSPNVEALTSALVARGQELQTLQAEMRTLKNDKEDTTLLKAQLELYRTDFEAEREARENMACQKENVLTDLRTAQKKVKELTTQLEQVRRLDSAVYWSAVSATSGSTAAPASGSAPTSRPATTATTRPATTGVTRKQIYTCPKCMKFKCDSYPIMESHLDYCLEIDEDPCSPV